MRILIIILLLAFVLVGCVEDERIKVGFIGPLAGDSAIVGQENLRGIILAAEDFDRISIVAKDDGLEDKETVSQYRQLVHAEGVRYILTVTYGGFIALANDAERDGVVLINSLDASEELAGIGENSFAVGIYDESIGHAIAAYLNDRNISSIGLLKNVEDPFIELVSRALVDEYAGFVDEERYSFDTKDFRTMLSKMPREGHIVLLGWEETGSIVRQARQLGMGAEFIGIDTFASEGFVKNAGGRLENIAFTFWEGQESNPAYGEMIAAYVQEHGRMPENVLFVATGYDAATLLFSAIAVCGEDSACVREWLAESVLVGATGRVVLDPDGIARGIRETMHRYEDGVIVPTD